MQSPNVRETYSKEELINLYMELFPDVTPTMQSKPVKMTTRMTRTVSVECLVSFNHFIACCPGLRRLDLETTVAEARRAYKQLLSHKCMEDFDEATRMSISTHLAMFLTPTPEREEILKKNRRVPPTQERLRNACLGKTFKNNGLNKMEIQTYLWNTHGIKAVGSRPQVQETLGICWARN